jgi:hypothetical protein
VRLLDISTLGCRLELWSDLPVDTWVWLKLPGLEPRYSRLAWCRGGFAGVEFEAPLHEAVVDVLAGIERMPTDTELDELRRISRRCRDLASGLDEDEADSAAQLIALAADCERQAGASAPAP